MSLESIETAQVGYRMVRCRILRRTAGGAAIASKPGETRERIKFGDDFEVDLRSYQLRQSGRVLKLEPTPMEILLFLIEHRGELITRDQIVEKIWGQGVFLDTDNSINGASGRSARLSGTIPSNLDSFKRLLGRDISS
jgi:DNA-binding response OmpR family regulator